MFPTLNERYAKTPKISEEDQHLYNHHIIENFVESVREMNGVVLIPSKLRDLETNPSAIQLKDDLYEYFRMINTVKNDLFEPHHHDEVNKSIFTPKRKISRIQRKEDFNAVTPSRKISTTSMSSAPSRVSSYTDLTSLQGINDENNDSNKANSSQLTDQFIHHLHSLYGILEHFTHAADYITEKYTEEVDSLA